MATSGEYGRSVSPRPPKKHTIDTPAATSIETKPTGLTAWSMPRRNSGALGEMPSRYLFTAMSVATTTTQAMPQLA